MTRTPKLGVSVCADFNREEQEQSPGTSHRGELGCYTPLCFVFVCKSEDWNLTCAVGIFVYVFLSVFNLAPSDQSASTMCNLLY